MIYDGYAWKHELRLKMRQIAKFNTKSYFDKSFDLSYHKIESAILFSAFIIRMLIESQKLSDDADKYTMNVKEYLPKISINRLHHWCEEDEYDWGNFASIVVPGKSICNQLIHSYVLRLIFQEDAESIGFFVSSDYDRNKKLIEVSIEDWMKYVDVIISDNVVAVETQFDKKKDDYIVIKKVRGNW